MRARLAAMEESRDRIQNHLRELEISIDPTRKELENSKNKIIEMKENKINEISALKSRLQKQR